MELDQQFPEQVEEYTDEQGRRVRRVVKKTVIRRSTEPEEAGDEEPTERVEEFVDDQGRKVCTEYFTNRNRITVGCLS